MIDGLNKLDELMKYPKTAIKINSVLKDCGFKRVLVNETFNKTKSYYKQLTISIRPTTNETMPHFTNFINYLRDKKGCNIELYEDFYSSSKEDIIKEIEIDGKKINVRIGRYYKDRNLFLFFPNIFETNLKDGLFKKEECLVYLLDLIKELVKTYKVKETEAKKVMDLMIESFGEEYKTQIKNYTNEIKSMDNNIKDYEKSIISNIRSKKMKEKQLDMVKYFKENGKERILSEIEKVEKLKFVEKVELDVDRIKVFVGDVSIKHLTKEYYIGNFVFEITPFKIFVDNLKPLEEDDGETDYDGHEELLHPHIHGNNVGQACFGDRKSKVYEFLGNFDLERLVHFLNLWVKGYNESGAYHKITNWEGVKTEEAKKKEEKEKEENKNSVPLVNISDGVFLRTGDSM